MVKKNNVSLFPLKSSKTNSAFWFALSFFKQDSYLIQLSNIKKIFKFWLLRLSTNRWIFQYIFSYLTLKKWKTLYTIKTNKTWLYFNIKLLYKIDFFLYFHFFNLSSLLIKFLILNKKICVNYKIFFHFKQYLNYNDLITFTSDFFSYLFLIIKQQTSFSLHKCYLTKIFKRKIKNKIIVSFR